MKIKSAFLLVTHKKNTTVMDCWNFIKRSTVGMLCLLAFAFSVQNASASIIYDESASGDLGTGPSTFFNLGIGTNSIFGIASLSDTDDFGIYAVPAGLEITGGNFTTIFSGTGSGFYNSSGIPIVGGGNFQGHINGNENVLIDSFTSGIFRVQNGRGSEPIAWRFDFTVVAASPVPEPATMMLFGIGLLGLAGVNRRKK